ncbi:MAG: 4Fe-4S binding protein [Rhodospirillaceae bacterium]|nr:4Fe-4S binding protein [Rhodospirillaceae bacterium]
MKVLLRSVFALVLAAAFMTTAAAQPAPTATEPSAAAASPQAPSLADLEALMEEDAAPDRPLDRREIMDLAGIAGFLALALISFWRKSTPLKYATMAVAIVYMGFMKGNLVSLVHIFGLVELSFPIFEYNMAWYALMIFTLASTVLWGRLYCGRICAFGALTQLMDRIIPSRFRYELPRSVDRKLIYAKYAMLFGAVGYFLITRDNFVYKYIEPFWMFTLSGTTVMWTLLALLLLTTVFIRNFYCRYLCSVGAGLGLISTLTVFGIKRWNQCKTCKLCDKTCEWGAIQGLKISKLECVRCDDCEILAADHKRCPHWLMLKKKQRKLAHLVHDV